jgi:hypothetical protein
LIGKARKGGIRHDGRELRDAERSRREGEASRRAVLAGALGGVAAEVALRAAPAEAADNVSKSKSTIHLNAAVPAAQTAKVAWFVVG